MMNAFKPDVLLLDIHLPDMSGKEILQRIKKEGSSIPVIAVSADAMLETINEVIALGAMGYLIKPIEAKRLKATMLKAFGS
jgi:two-component system repressor protein LuxO